MRAGKTWKSQNLHWVTLGTSAILPGPYLCVGDSDRGCQIDPEAPE